MRDKEMEYTESVDSITIDSPEVQPLKEHLAHKKGYLVVKRLIDLVGSIVGVVLTIPFIFVVGIAIKLESKSLRAKVFFVQERVGKDGKTFKMIILPYLFQNIVPLHASMEDVDQQDSYHQSIH